MTQDHKQDIFHSLELKPKLEEIISGGVSTIRSKPFEDDYIKKLSCAAKNITLIEEARKLPGTLHQERTAEAAGVVTSTVQSLVHISPSLHVLEKELDSLVSVWSCKNTDDKLQQVFSRLTAYNQLYTLQVYLGTEQPKISSFYQDAQSLKMLVNKNLAEKYLQQYQETSSSLSLNKFQTDFEEKFWKVLEAKRSTLSRKYAAQKHFLSSPYKLLSAEPITLFRELQTEAKKAEKNIESLLNLRSILAHYESLLSAKEITAPSSKDYQLVEQLRHDFPLYTASLAERYKTVQIELRLLREQRNYRQKSYSVLPSLESENGGAGDTYDKQIAQQQRKVKEEERVRETADREKEIKLSSKPSVRTESSVASKTTEPELSSPRELMSYANQQLPYVQGEVHRFCALVAGYDGKLHQSSWKKRFAEAGTLELSGLEGREKEVYQQLKNGMSKYVVV